MCVYKPSPLQGKFGPDTLYFSPSLCDITDQSPHSTGHPHKPLLVSTTSRPSFRHSIFQNASVISQLKPTSSSSLHHTTGKITTLKKGRSLCFCPLKGGGFDR